MSQSNDTVNGLQFNNNTQVITMNAFPQIPQVNDTNNFMQARPVNAFQVPQTASPYQPQMYQNVQYMPAVPNMNGFAMNTMNGNAFGNGTVPVLLIPASSIGPGGQIQLGAPIGQEQQQQPFLFKTNEGQQFSSSPSILSYNIQQQQPVMGNAMQNNNKANQGWMNPNQPVQASNPVIIVSSNKAPTIQNQQMSFNIQNGQTNGIIQGGMIPANINMNGTNMPTYISYEPPMQIQYLTSLYCPYSNNNIFSGCYPMVVQNGSGFPVQNPGKPGGMENMTGNSTPVITQQIPNSTFQFSNGNGGVFRNAEMLQNPNLFRNDKAPESNRF